MLLAVLLPSVVVQDPAAPAEATLLPAVRVLPLTASSGLQLSPSGQRPVQQVTWTPVGGAAIDIPLATGERDRTIWGMIPYLQERCVDILQPDCGQTGGISQMKKIATLAEAWFVPLAPHCTATFLGIAASLHVVSSIPFFLIHEFYPQNAGFNVPGLHIG
jgi:hypothetical protein